eukprot:1195353-Prorocentrum_minimum.AAC.1
MAPWLYGSVTMTCHVLMWRMLIGRTCRAQVLTTKQGKDIRLAGVGGLSGFLGCARLPPYAPP